MTSFANHTPLHNDVSPKLEVTLTCLYCYDCQPLWLWYDLYGDKAEKGTFSDFDRVIMEDGVLHEAEIIKGMNLQAVGECDPSAAIAATLKLMQEGAELIYQGVIEAEIDGVIYRGRPDLLKRIECLSTLGSWRYMPIDIKNSKEVKPAHKRQLIFYIWILDALQGPGTVEGAIINRDGATLSVDLTDAKEHAKVAERCKDICAIKAGQRPPFNVTSSAKSSPWFKLMLREAIEQQNLSLIYKLDGRAVTALRQQNINTLPQFLAADLSTLPKIPYAPSDKLQRAQKQARALLEKKAVWLAEPKLPRDDQLQLFFDIEGDPRQGVEYLFGFWVVGDRDKSLIKHGISHRVFSEQPDKYFLYFIADTPQQEKDLWHSFLAWLEHLPDQYSVYHYADYERSHLNSLAEKYGDSAARQSFMSHLIDLDKLIQQSVVLPLCFYSLKDIAKSDMIGFQWRHEKAGGGQSILWYEQWLNTHDRKILDLIIDYNEDDVRATECLYQWLLTEQRSSCSCS